MTSSGERVYFVAHPGQCIQQTNCYRPDDNMCGTNRTWRNYLESYNESGLNPDNLRCAWNLYAPSIYGALVQKYGVANVFILSAGWGLIRSDFLIPYYDITFSHAPKTPAYAKRRKNDLFNDFNQLQNCHILDGETIYFFGGQDYLSLYYRLTRNITARKVIYHARGVTYQVPGYVSIPFRRSYTNWHYECARDFISGKVSR